MSEKIRVIDLFAGPGGLGEGFSSLLDADGERIFQIVMSVEMEKSAHSTLRLRSFFRKIYDLHHRIPEQYLAYMANPDAAHLEDLKKAFPDQWAYADHEAVQGKLVEGDPSYVEEAKRRLVGYSGYTVIIGGPPCQAYSLVGRARRTNDPTLQGDVKQTLYKCYLSFLEGLQPDIFVMENVKGILSARLHNEGVLGMIRADIDKAGYNLHSLVVDDPRRSSDYIVRSEQYGIPQARHRVILLGIRKDHDFVPDQLRPSHHPSTVRDALLGIPSLRSDFSRRSRDYIKENWDDYVLNAARYESLHCGDPQLAEQLSGLTAADLPSMCYSDHIDDEGRNLLSDWYRGRLDDAGSRLLTNHAARSHMASDLDRYLFCAAYAAVHGKAAKLDDFPAYLLPNHRNVEQSVSEHRLKTVEFADRFRPQLYDAPSTTITSHISKDGHYFIHPDFRQCRSLTVREAARLQTFPDDYFFEGNRTLQFQQVGNAVPPLLANQIAQIVARCLGRYAENYFDAEAHRSDSNN
ncbi:DNA cytosine methyltransferase [Bifidobacterium avesanii]|uniref:DNA (cytosine-5-)-methyltransferase n=1 Tax=Bifidobacterium avesanii TaxID=1798157 RepID=A0A7K3TM58_9BIFI|nr:DNA cytosine methyltransferase [Bifidobacterium avesanii]KAB8287259.1 cytosine methyltransferase [Bifidobacterium avesanii]NEG79353.1 DNA (cytosine-5-)-methyltransferase [Bifidobacterium avesanii]